jgi:FixJ family two-component response regulator
MQDRATIVLVEDDQALNRAIVRLLQAAGFRPLTFLSGEALLASDAVRQASCLVIDLHLPGISGFDLHQQLSQLGSSCPAIFITAHDEPGVRVRAHKSGKYLVKPFLGQSLLQLVESTLSESPQEPKDDH